MTIDLQRLRAHAMLGSAPADELEWLAARGRLRVLDRGEILVAADEEVPGLYAVLSGGLEIHIERAYGRRKVMEWSGGDVTGVLPYSRMTASPGTVRATDHTELFELDRRLLPELPTACPKVTETLVHVMLDRARRFTSADLQDQKALALGKVAAGLAHELNNPASALIRSSKMLVETLAAARRATATAGAAQLTPEALEAAEALYARCRDREPVAWDAMDRADREQAIEEWLESEGEDPGVAGVLADSPLSLDELFGVVDGRPARAGAAAACRVARTMVAEELAAEIEEGASRVFHLVDAVRRFTHMDRPMAVGPVDLNASLRDAALLVSEKARAAGVAVALRLDDRLPSIGGVVEELNQTWHALIDNAVDAAAPNGTVEVRSAAEAGAAVVTVRDDGAGIPEEIRDRIFDPFFTTKPVGAGAGLGLELVRRVLDQHRGEIEVDSRPGETVFRVRLPA